MAAARKRIPFEFVLDALASEAYRTNPMFGCTAVYLGERIVFCLREKTPADESNGVWVATTLEHHESLRRELPSLRSIAVLGEGVTGWQNIPADSPTFESEVLRACELALARDPRIGKVPARKSPRRKPLAPSRSSRSTR